MVRIYQLKSIIFSSSKYLPYKSTKVSKVNKYLSKKAFLSLAYFGFPIKFKFLANEKGFYTTSGQRGIIEC